ncbi:MAG: diaminopimelate decarboxylase, partial [Bacteroidales bacterium]|nr:diaminopimelate decarboxylase [Bacteroidales bacterium]
MLSRQIAETLRKHRTPFYLYDIDLLRQTLESVTSVAARYGYVIHYAIKANFDPHILELIKEYGLGVDCASGNEVRCAIEAGFDPSGIVYAGVGKRDHEIRYAIEQGIFAINAESLQEIEVIDSIASSCGKVQSIGLRVNPDIDPKTNKCIDTGQADSKFG